MSTPSASESCILSSTAIKSVMTKNVQCLMSDDSISDALAMMIDAGITTSPVVNSNDKCIGILSRSDLTGTLLDEDGELSRLLDTSITFGRFVESLETCDSRKVSEMMTYEVETIRENQSVAEACQVMSKRKIHHLPVVDDQGKLVGMISSFDVVNAVANSN